ncbi:hypothetical protein FRC10_008321 [Ceratobasidium sp. 414]|nr:hypothetical protein FRC10_008321 [Ceratobasidium sp. 414]
MTVSGNGQSASKAEVAGVVSFYMAAALVMVFVNKLVLNAAPQLPVLFLFNQMLIAVALLHISAALSPRVKLPSWDYATAKGLVPVVSVNAIGLVWNTLCLRAVDASYFQIARGLVLPLTVLVAALHGRKRPSLLVIAAVALVTCGFIIGTSPSGTTTSATAQAGLIYGALGALAIAIHAVLIGAALPIVNGSALELAYWTNAGSAALLVPLLLLNGEGSQVWGASQGVYQSWASTTAQSAVVNNGEINWSVFIVGSLVTGVFGFLLCVATLISIKVREFVNPVTHMFTSAVRSVLQTVLGVWLFKDILTVNRVSSIMVILLGSCLYTWVKSYENRRRAAQSTPAQAENATPKEAAEKV